MGRLSLFDRLLEMYRLLTDANMPTDQANAEAIRRLPILLLEAGAEEERLAEALRAVNARSVMVELPGLPGHQVTVQLPRQGGK